MTTAERHPPHGRDEYSAVPFDAAGTRTRGRDGDMSARDQHQREEDEEARPIKIAFGRGGSLESEGGGERAALGEEEDDEPLLAAPAVTAEAVR
jgi:hypothetical protein